jgi:hypothetical protein
MYRPRRYPLRIFPHAQPLDNASICVLDSGARVLKISGSMGQSSARRSWNITDLV